MPCEISERNVEHEIQHKIPLSYKMKVQIKFTFELKRFDGNFIIEYIE
jgi:hypothetical protein